MSFKPSHRTTPRTCYDRGVRISNANHTLERVMSEVKRGHTKSANKSLTSLLERSVANLPKAVPKKFDKLAKDVVRHVEGARKKIKDGAPRKKQVDAVQEASLAVLRLALRTGPDCGYHYKP